MKEKPYRFSDGGSLKKSFLVMGSYFLIVLFLHLPHWRQPWYWDSLGAYYGVTVAVHNASMNPFLGGGFFHWASTAFSLVVFAGVDNYWLSHFSGTSSDLSDHRCSFVLHISFA
jgi:hypothetical protein